MQTHTQPLRSATAGEAKRSTGSMLWTVRSPVEGAAVPAAGDGPAAGADPAGPPGATDGHG